MIPVLIVDDNPYNREVLASVLASENIPVEEAANGKQALELVAKNKYQLILMDILMPGMNGYEVIRKMRQMGIDTPAVAQSSMSTKDDRLRSFEAGFIDFLPKPYDIAELIRLVEKYTAGETDTSKNAETAPVAREIRSREFPGYNALLVEENDAVAEQYLCILRKIKLGATRVLNGAEAWEKLQNKENIVNIIISHIFTSGIDGLGLLSMVKREFPKILVFLYTPDFDKDILQLSMQLKADGFIPQPVFEDSIAELIDSALSRSAIRISSKSDDAVSEQIRESQAQLIQFGFDDVSGIFDYAYEANHEAGGDIARIRRFNRAGRYGIALADVSGHDIRSSYLSAIFLGVLTSVWNAHQEPGDLLGSLNTELLKLNNRNYHTCVTAVLWDQWRKKIKIATAGNPGCILLSRSARGTFEKIQFPGGGICLGLLERNDLYQHTSFDFKAGDLLLLFSDGINEELLIDALHGEEERLLLRNISGLSRRLLDKILNKRIQEDDMILVTLQAPDDTRPEGLHYQFVSNFNEVDKAYSWLHAQLKNHAIPAGIDPDFLLIAVREALLNAVEHGNRRMPDSIVDMSLYFRDDELRVEVSDCGPGFNLAQSLAPKESLSGFQIGKRGLPLMKFVADEIEVDGGTVSLVFRRKL